VIIQIDEAYAVRNKTAHVKEACLRMVTIPSIGQVAATLHPMASAIGSSARAQTGNARLGIDFR
jgi:hypothetical protein